MKDGEEVTKANVGDKVVLSADARDIDDGARIRINIWEKDEIGNDDFIKRFSTYVENGKIEKEWKVEYHEDTDDAESGQELKEKGYTLPEYVFKMETIYSPDAESGESPVLEVKGLISCILMDETEELLINREYIIFLPDGTEKEGITDENGRIEEKDLLFNNKYYILLK